MPNWVYFDQGENFKLTMELPEKVQYSRNQAIKSSLNEAILLMSINEALLILTDLGPTVAYSYFKKGCSCDP